jgi:hypothetical protein
MCINTLGDLETLQDKHMIKAIVLVFRRRLELILNPTPPPSAELHHTYAFAHVREYIRTIHALIPNTHVTPFDETIGIFTFSMHLLRLIFPFR